MFSLLPSLITALECCQSESHCNSKLQNLIFGIYFQFAFILFKLAFWILSMELLSSHVNPSPTLTGFSAKGWSVTSFKDVEVNGGWVLVLET